MIFKTSFFELRISRGEIFMLLCGLIKVLEILSTRLCSIYALFL